MKKKIQINKTTELKAAMREFLDTQGLISKLDNDIDDYEHRVKQSEARKEDYTNQIIAYNKMTRRWFIGKHDLEYALKQLLTYNKWYADECKVGDEAMFCKLKARNDRADALQRLRKARIELGALLA